jgi:hypothetical protein
MQNNNKLRRFFNTFGSRVITAVRMGGEFSMDLEYHRCMASQYTKEYVENNRRSSFIIGSTRSGNGHIYESFDAVWKEWAASSCKISGGRAWSVDPPERDQWVPTIEESPIPIDFETDSWISLLPDSIPQKQVLMMNVEKFLQNFLTFDRGYWSGFAAMDPRINPNWCSVGW